MKVSLDDTLGADEFLIHWMGAYMSLQNSKKIFIVSNIALLCVYLCVFVCVFYYFRVGKIGSMYILGTINTGDSPSDDVCKRKLKVVNRKEMTRKTKISKLKPIWMLQIDKTFHWFWFDNIENGIMIYFFAIFRIINDRKIHVTIWATPNP